ncbi:MAG: winged helix-turn-helix domain-containing protein, partial [Pyrinomonadaceae bacterium]
MPLQTKSLYEFGDFRLDLEEKVLLRDGAVVSMTPKVFETLQVLVERAGHLVEKDELMQRIWQDRFVGENNLAFNIKMLRKALGDDAVKPRFIETVPRRGYRFVAAVAEGIVQPTSINHKITNISRSSEHSPARTGSRKHLLSALVVFCIGMIGGGLWYARSNDLDAPPILSATFSSENLSTSGRVLNAVISPDGKTVAYTNGLGSDRQSVWLKQLDTSNNIQIVPPSDEFYYDLAFSPDGNFLYFVRGARPADPAKQYAIYRISTFGGMTTKIVDEVQGGISVSSDGGRISFVRCQLRDDEWCSLWIADAADGKNERKIVSRPSPFRIGDNQISPDGRTIAFGVGQSRNGANAFGLAMVDIESAVETELTQDKFFDIKSLNWLPDQRAVLITAIKFPDNHYRIWQVSTGTGETALKTRGSEDYWGISLDNAASVVVATQRRSDFHLNLYSADDPMKARQVFADAATVSFARDGKLIVSAGRPGDIDLWSINADGGEQRQLTNSPLDDLDAVVSPDGNSMFFASNRTGETQVWRMKVDGSDQKQITAVEGGIPLGISPDGQWLYYHSALGKTLRRVLVGDGREEPIVDKKKHAYSVSPDCSLAAFTDGQGVDGKLTVVTLPDGQTVGSYRLGGDKTRLSAMAWSNDGKNLFYVTTA